MNSCISCTGVIAEGKRKKGEQRWEWRPIGYKSSSHPVFTSLDELNIKFEILDN